MPTSEEAQPARKPTERKQHMAKVIIDAVRKNFLTGQSVVDLLDEAGRRFIPIWIPKLEALVIALGMTGIAAPRPTTTHFMANVMKATGVQLEEVRIETLKDDTYYAVAKVRNGELVRDVDVRPSDALGLAVLMECPIFVAEDILAKQGVVVPEGKTAELFFAEQWLEHEGITLPGGKTVQINYDKEHTRAAVLKEMEEVMNAARQEPSPTAEEQEQAKQRYLAFLMGEDA